jgi:PAS domain S-box-containing protein
MRDIHRQDSLSFNQVLRTHCDTIAERWCGQIASTSYLPNEDTTPCRHLVELSFRAIRLLLAEPFEPEKAEEIGGALARLYYLQPEALGGTLQVVAGHLAEDLPPDSATVIKPRLAEMVDRLATGFFHQARQTIIEEEELQGELSAEQKRAKRELRIKESAITSSINGIVIANMEGFVTYVNRSFLDMWGYDEMEEVLGRHVLQFWEDKEAAEAVLRAVQSGLNWTGGLVARKVDGSLVDIRLSARAVVDEDGRALCMMGSFVDITEQRKMEKTLMEREAELEERTRRLEEVNTTLKVLLEKRAEDKNMIVERVQLNTKELVLPLLKRLKKAVSDPQQLSRLDMIESNLNNITSSFSHLLSSRYQELTPMEIRVANLVREGKKTKEIAELMNLSPRTIESHRESLRMKLGIRCRRKTIRNHLLSLS